MSEDNFDMTTPHHPDYSTNQNILYNWCALALPFVKPHGQLICGEPAPLFIPEILRVMQALANHDAYTHQRIEVSSAPDAQLVVLDDGSITVAAND